MKASVNGDRIALVNRAISSFEVLDFDNSTGQITNPITFSPNYDKAYGVEFSADGTKVYLSEINKLWQFDLNVPTAGEVVNSGLLISSSVETL